MIRRKNLRLDQAKIDRARRIFRAQTEREAIRLPVHRALAPRLTRASAHVHEGASVDWLSQVWLDTISRLAEAADLVRSTIPGAVVRTAVVADRYADLDGDMRIAASLTSSFAVFAPSSPLPASAA